LGSYTLLSKLGSGSFAEVYLGTPTSSSTNEKQQQQQQQENEHDAFVAIKLTPKSDTEAYDILSKEARVFESLQKKSAGDSPSKEEGEACHPNIVKLLDTIDTPTHFGIVLEKCETDLLDLMTSISAESESQQSRSGKIEEGEEEEEEGPLKLSWSEDEIRLFVKEALTGLAYLHENGVAHRDVKLENFLLSVTDKTDVEVEGERDDGESDTEYPCHRRKSISSLLSCSTLSTSSSSTSIRSSSSSSSSRSTNQVISLKNSTPKLCDFGLALQLPATTTSTTTTDTTTTTAPLENKKYTTVIPDLQPVGSDQYLSPELILTQDSDPRSSDIYAFGVCTFSLLTGRFPIDTDTDTNSSISTSSHSRHSSCSTTAGSVSSSYGGSGHLNPHKLAMQKRRRMLAQVVRGEWRFTESEILQRSISKEAQEFVRRCMDRKWEKRATVWDLLEDAWIQG
jgi:serine/threonine protein kinase